MHVVFHDEFTKSLGRLDTAIKAKVLDTVQKLQRDPDGGGLDLKLPRGAADRRVRTARVDLNFRAVLAQFGQGAGAHLVLLTVLPHDDAYTFASSARLDVNPASGALELSTTAPTPAPTPATERPVVPPPRPARLEAPQLLPFTVDELTGLGIGEAVAARAITLTDEGDLLRLTDGLPTWQENVLLDLTSGRNLEDVRDLYVITPVSAAEQHEDDALVEALNRPTSRMSFGVVTDDEDLARMITGDFASWRVFLHPTQRAVAERETYRGPFRISGGAGTGKTVVALHRAAYLIRRDPQARVLLCTFNRPMSARLEADLASLLSGEEMLRVDVLGVDQFAHKVLSGAGRRPTAILGDREELALWQEALQVIAAARNPRITAAFLKDEYRYVMLAQGVQAESDYLAVPRRGRGVRLDRAQRRQVWQAVEEFSSLRRQNGRTTYAQIAADAADVMTGDKAPPGCRYDHVVVDEGQDLHPAHWRLLRAAVEPGPNDIFLCEDGHQRLYGQKVVLSHLGIETRGRSRCLTLNYRTTRQILAASLAVLQDAPVEDLEGQSESTQGYRSALSGCDPELYGHPDREAELKAAADVVRRWVESAETPQPGTIAVLTRRKRDADNAARLLGAAGLAAGLSGASGREDRPVLVSTMHSAKGAEYQHVLVLHADDDTIPERMAVDAADADERDDVLLRERLLLYVACSRARDDLVVTWSGKPSRFLAGLVASEQS